MRCARQGPARSSWRTWNGMIASSPTRLGAPIVSSCRVSGKGRTRSPGKVAANARSYQACRPGGPAIVSGRVRLATNCASSTRNGTPPKWSAWKCVSRMRSMLVRSIASRFSAISDEAPQSIRKEVRLAATWKHVLKRPPDPNASPEPTNVIRKPALPPSSRLPIFTRRPVAAIPAAHYGEGEPGGDTGFCGGRPALAGRREVRAATLTRVISRPAVAMGELVAADLGLDCRGHRPADLRDHHEAPAFVDLGAAQRAIRRHDSLHRVAVMLDLPHGPLAYGQGAPAGVVVDGRRSVDRVDWGVRGIHSSHPKICCQGRRDGRRRTISTDMHSSSSERRRRNLCCMRQTGPL